MISSKWALFKVTIPDFSTPSTISLENKVAAAKFSDEVFDALDAYRKQKKLDPRVPADEPAFFLSMQYKRINVRSVEILVKKYSKLAAPLKKITPHKLRSTYGTRLYQETGDIYIVADVLGHRDVNTTKKHYAAITEENRRRVANIVKLRGDDEN